MSNQEEQKGAPVVLLTGGTGFIGRNILPTLVGCGTILTPGRAELDLRQEGSVSAYALAHGVTHIVHCANPNPAKNAQDKTPRMFEDSLGCFLNVYEARKHVQQILYLGSGAEYDKRMDVAGVTEDEAMRSVPQDAYGKAKFAMNALARQSDNVYNLRIFGCYGPGDHYTKFITHCVRSVLVGRTITIRQDCFFDYLHVYDLAKVVAFYIAKDPVRHDLNVASGKRVSLGQIAHTVLDVMGSDVGVQVLAEGLNREYTCDVERMRQDIGQLYDSFIPLEEGIRIQAAYERAHMQEWVHLNEI